jgi:hypothetical protein
MELGNLIFKLIGLYLKIMFTILFYIVVGPFLNFIRAIKAFVNKEILFGILHTLCSVGVVTAFVAYGRAEPNMQSILLIVLIVLLVAGGILLKVTDD